MGFVKLVSEGYLAAFPPSLAKGVLDFSEEALVQRGDFFASGFGKLAHHAFLFMCQIGGYFYYDPDELVSSAASAKMWNAHTTKRKHLAK